MSISADELNQYLARVGLDAPLTADEVGLAQLHAAHAFVVPFENLDIQLGRGVSLDAHDIFDKLVTRRRGGYCFEQNSLFERILRGLGFVVRSHMARVVLGASSDAMPSRSHQILLVTIDGREWLADVGFGGSGLRAPIPFEVDRIDEQFGQQFRILHHDIGYVLQTLAPKGWRDLYIFALDPVFPSDLRSANHFTSTHANSRFVTERFVTQPNAEGRKTLLGMEFSTFTGNQRVTRTINPGKDYMDLLVAEFGIFLDANFEDFKVLPGD